MGARADSSNKMEKHLNVVTDEYAKISVDCNDQKSKYTGTINPESLANNCTSSFLPRLALTIGSFCGRPVFSDVTIKMRQKSMPAHKLVLTARSDYWNEQMLAATTELDWRDYEQESAEALLQWIYTDSVDLQQDQLALELIKLAHRFNLPPLLGICERALISSVGARSCVKFYCVAEEVGANMLLEFCSNLICSHWHELTSHDFEHMSSTLLYKMLKDKMKYPLHSAIKLLREDVVVMCLADDTSQVNCLSDQGKLPLQMAFETKNFSIAEVLINSGSANVNAYDANGCPILVNAVKQCDEAATLFLLENNCQADASISESGDTALHILAEFNSDETDKEKYENSLKILKLLLSSKMNVNIKNSLGKTPLHIALENENYSMVDELLLVDTIDVNLLSSDDCCAMEIILSKNNDRAISLAERMLKLGANVQRLKASSQNSLLQVMAAKCLENAAIFLVPYVDVNNLNCDGITALHIAAEHNMYELVKNLLRFNAKPNMQSSLYCSQSPLHLAVTHNNLKVIEAFVEYSLLPAHEPIDFNIQNLNGETLLNLCIKTNKADLIPILLKGGADLNVRNGKNLTLLHNAIIEKDTEMAHFILNHGADMNILTGDMKTPLHLAIEYNLPEVVNDLCKRGVALCGLQETSDPPLWTALNLGHFAIASVLVKNGADTDCWTTSPNGYQQTLLHRAIAEKEEDIATFLIKNHCDLDTPRQGCVNEDSKNIKERSSPLHMSCKIGLSKIVQSLIDHGANVNSLDCENKTPLHIAIENDHCDIISILLCHPLIDLKLRDMNGNTAFARALNMRNHKAARKILERLPNAAEQMDFRGRNFLHLAILNEDLESVLFLICMHVDINSRIHDANQSTPLHLAATCKNEMITRNLILAGSRVNECDAIHKTPLHIAAERGNLGAVSALIQNSADFDAVDGDGNNALHIAVRCGHLSVVSELLTESRINAEAINHKGRNPLHELCRTCEDVTAPSICELFLECMPKYPINIPDNDGNTPLLLAFMRGQAPLCKVLVKNGATLGYENRDGVSIFSFKLATDQLLHNLLDQLPKESPWSESDYCQNCNTKFTLTMRKHHCRHCGRMLCSKCSNYDVPIIKFGINKPVRVCEVCFDVLHGSMNSM